MDEIWKEILARLEAGESIEDLIPVDTSRGRENPYVEMPDTLGFYSVQGMGFDRPFRSELRDLLIREGMDPDDEGFTQQGIGELLSNTAFADSLASVRSSLPSQYVTRTERYQLSDLLGRLLGWGDGPEMERVLPSEKPMKVRLFGRRDGVAGYVDPNRGSEIVHMNMFYPFVSLTDIRDDVRSGETDFPLTEQDWNRSPEDQFRNTLLHEMWHSTMENIRYLSDDERLAESFASAFNALAGAEPEDTREDIVSLGVEDYLSKAFGERMKIATSRQDPDDPSVVTVPERQDTRPVIRNMINKVAQSPVFFDNPWHLDPPEEEPESLFSQVIRTLQTTKHGLKHMFGGGR
jgi:hypothetical protein|tara:strand:- start:642 stop:1688 length:1047 start_codon:yes stop_codon:yes gene_type:complete